MTPTMMRARRVTVGVVAAAFSVGIIATSASGTVLQGAGHTTSVTSTSSHVTSMHKWGN